MFRKALIAGLVTAATATTALAQTPPAEPAAAAPAAAPAEPPPPYTLTGNIGIFSQYIFRGLTQTDRQPALQGGFDFAHSSGFYAGTWLSNISWLKEGASTPLFTAGQYANGGSVEWDIYGGYKANFGSSDFTYDVGLLYYYYPGNVVPGCTYGTNACPKGDTLEAYVAFGWKFITLKYSHSVLNHTFGVPNSRNTNYIDLSADVPIGDTGLTANLHVGRQTYKGSNGLITDNDGFYSYSDWKAGLSYALPKDFTVGAYASGTGGANVLGYGGVSQGGPYPHALGKTTGTVFIKKTF
jgi:uncharacterized protein (TIGR02001 family)